MERTNFSLRLLPSLLKAAQRIAEAENCSVNQLINVALAEKIAVLDADRWAERRRKAIANPPSSDIWKQHPAGEMPQEREETATNSQIRKRSSKPRTLKAGEM